MGVDRQYKACSGSQRPKPEHERSRLTFQELEPRIAFDGALLATAIDGVDSAPLLSITSADQSDPSDNNSNLDISSFNATGEDDGLLSALAGLDAPVAAFDEIVFVDPTVADLDTLLAELDPGIEVMILDPHADGVSQMADHLADRSGIDAVHIISHGSQGQLNLGNSALTLDSMASYHAEALSAINGSLSDGADILIYGCNFGEGAVGQQAALQLAMLTGADIAASDDLTGHEVEGGDWDLEVETGAIEADIFLAASSEKSWTGSLDVTSNLVGHWTFDEGSGASAADSSTNSNTGTLIDGPGWDSGHIGSGALDLSSNFDRVEVTNDASLDLGGGDFTISFWVNSSHSGSQGRIIGDGDGVNDGIIIYADSFGQIVAEARSGGSSVSRAIGNGLDGSWHHFVFRRTGNSFEAFLDTSSFGGTSMSLGSVDNSNTMMMGASSAVSNEFDGLLDDIRIYDRALSSSDITELFNLTNSDPTGSPAITGTAQEGQTLTADTSGISDADGLGAFSYQWQSGWVDIPGATSFHLFAG